MFELTDVREALRMRAREFARGHVAARAAEVDRTEEYPWDTVEKLTEAGFMGMTIPETYGGHGLCHFDTALVIEEMARCAA